MSVVRFDWLLGKRAFIRKLNISRTLVTLAASESSFIVDIADNQIKITGFTKLSRTFDHATETFDIHLFLFFLELESHCLHA